MPQTHGVESGLKGLFRVGGAAMLAATVLAPAEVAIGLLPGTQAALAQAGTVQQWFRLFQGHAFLGLRQLGLLNLIGALLLAPAILAVYCALRTKAEAWALPGAALFFSGISVYLASNRAFPMLALARQYAGAGSDAQRLQLEAAGQAMLAVGESRSGLMLVETGCLLLAAAMLGSGVFSKTTAWIGIAGNGLMIAVEILLAVEGKLTGPGMAVAGCGGLSIVTWYALTGARLLRPSVCPAAWAAGKQGGPDTGKG